MRRSLTLGPLIAACTIAAAAQSPPARPALPAGSDTNDASAYLAWGKSKLTDSPKDAAAAFYWALRVDPSRANVYYARWVAFQVANPSRYNAHYDRKKAVLLSPDVQGVDSIELRAVEMAPLDYRDLDGALVPLVSTSHGGTYSTFEKLGTVVNSVDSVAINAGAVNPLVAQMGAAAPNGPPNIPHTPASIVRAWTLYAVGAFPQSLNDYAAVLSGAKTKWAIYGERGRIFALTNHPDSALAQLALAIGAFPDDPAHELTYVYESVAIDEHMRGLVHEGMKHADSARAAYQRALDADPSYAPAHLRLAALDLSKGDTTAALSHFDLAAQVRPSDGVIAYQYGFLLIKSGHDAEAIEQLERASQLEPWFAAPRFLAAAVYDAHDMKPKAVADYTSFVTLAAKRDPLVSRAKERLAALQ